MNLPKTVAKMRFEYHGTLLDINNVLNQLGLRNDEKAEEIAKRHVMTMINDIAPRLGYDVGSLAKEEA